MYNDRERKIKPTNTAKFLVKLLSKKEIIPQNYVSLVIILDKLSDPSITDILTLIFNFILQFQTMNLKNANSIPKMQVKNYDYILKAIFMRELDRIQENYLQIIFDLNLNIQKTI